MHEFITGNELSERIREILSGAEVRCAVAFWGTGAVSLLEECAPVEWRKARIVCDVSMGCTSPEELRRLSDACGTNLRHRFDFHAKVYLSEAGAVVTSANASSNGIGFAGCKAGLSEAGAYLAPNEPAWSDAAAWFERIFDSALPVDAETIRMAEKRWRRCKGAGTAALRSRPDSLLDLVKEHPAAFERVGFVFVENENRSEDIGRAIESLERTGRSDASIDRLRRCKPEDIFSGWQVDDVLKWPAMFFEFWMPGNRLYVIARQRFDFDANEGAIFSKRNPPAMRAHLYCGLPSLRAAGRKDAAVAKALLEKYKNKLFSTPGELLSCIEKVTPRR